ncbi:MAG: hypothetical protein JWM37_1 [Candidatus Saccharibacteria bacterium]|nr:hypothetical protein [Candidatus Saccharibacteria bacterium]
MGLWPLLHYKSFEMVTGRKTDTWLVKTIACLFIVIGMQLWLEPSSKVAVLGIGSALVIGGADLYYSTIKKRISRVYALDAIPQIVFILLWVMGI